ncbi:KamA family radical SAM protein [Bradyrhizobium sp. CCBAU 65884]|uniref:KamA family radical SAM protein n=1 Tax=Bradyrhizobium sp. CCBAU 65884 TaxID=722477 RepID=UPI002305C115|nr:KamA family radical SAM protein [Bradyrhizobium sp. CCBAU 65884]
MLNDESIDINVYRDRPEWNDWTWQMQRCIKSVSQLESWIKVTPHERKAIDNINGKYQWRITPYYASLMDPVDPRCPIRLQAVPAGVEMAPFPDAEVDPVGDTYYRKTNRIIHKYPDRALFLITSICPVYCRHCTRKYHTSDLEGSYFGEAEGASFEKDYAYIESHAEIRDIILSGGDPLTYGDRRLEKILKRLRSIRHVEIIRVGSRCPVFLPMRITKEFCEMLSRYHPIWFQTHFNHPKEITEDAAAACDRLLSHGIPVQNQAVLLKGVNDNIDAMRALMTGLQRIRVLPYYLYHCDNVVGVSHFMTTIAKGREIMRGLLGYSTGFSSPKYVLTTRLGKIPLTEEYVSSNDSGYRVTNYLGQTMDIRHV